MYESLIEQAERAFPKKALLSVEELAEFLSCDPKVIYNWTRRSELDRRPPRVIIGREVRFPRNEFMQWLVREQERK